MSELFKKIKIILTPEEQSKAYIILYLSLFAAVLEMVGISLIVPIVNFYSNEMNFNFYNSFFSFDLKNNIEIFIVIFFVALIIKSIFIFYIKWLTNRYCARVHVNLSHRMFVNYIDKEYKFHIENNSSTLHRNVYDSSVSFISVLRSVLNIFLDFFCLLLLISLLLFTNFMLTFLLLISIGTVFFLLNFFINKFSSVWGKKRHINIQQMLKDLIQGFASIKEVKFLKSEKEFSNKFRSHMNEYATNDMYFNTIILLPRYLFEILLLLTVAIFLYVNNVMFYLDNLTYIVLAIYTSLRLFPIFNRLITNINNIKFFKSAIEIISTEILEQKNKIKEKNGVFSKFSDDLNIENIEIKSLNFKYDNSDKFLIKNLSLKISKNEKTIIYGKSGSGKSTLVDIFLGLLEPTSGEIVFNNEKKLNDYRNIWHKKIGYVPQNPNFIDESIVQNVAFGVPLNKIDKSKVVESLKFASVYDDIIKYHNNIDNHMGERGIKLSGGQKQRIAIARALYKDPSFIVFDEATNNLDKENEKKLIDDILKLNKTIIFVSHNDTIRNLFDKTFDLSKY